MKALQTMTSPEHILKQSGVKAEILPSGESITQAISMGNKNCCGSAYAEKAE